jgi:hypothetical protein
MRKVSVLFGIMTIGLALVGTCAAALAPAQGVTPSAHPVAVHPRILHSFPVNGHDGYYPQAGLVSDSSGNLYGTTFYGGAGVCGRLGCGAVFELSPRPGGGWVEKVLHSFTGGRDGRSPAAGLIFDSSGDLFGTTFYGGDGGGKGVCSGGGMRNSL